MHTKPQKNKVGETFNCQGVTKVYGDGAVQRNTSQFRFHMRGRKHHLQKKSRNQDAKFQTVKYYKIETDRTCTEMVLLITEILL